MSDSDTEALVHRCAAAEQAAQQALKWFNDYPDQIAAQVEGSVAYGLSTFLSEISVDKGRVAELNFHSYPLLRVSQMPKVETVIVPTFDFWGGVGEPTICVVAPSVLNAIFAATGKPVRSLPLKNHGMTLV